MKKQQRVIFILLSIIFAAVIYYALMSYHSTKTFVIDSVERDTDELLRDFSAEVDRFSKERILDLELMSYHVSFLKKMDEDVGQFLSEQNDRQPYFLGLGFVSLDGEISAADGSSFPVKQRDSIQRAFEGEVSFSNVFTMKQQPELRVMAISVPVMDAEDEVLGVVSGIIDLNDLISELVEESTLPGTVYMLKNKELLYASKDLDDFTNQIPGNDVLIREMERNEAGRWHDPDDPQRFIKYGRTWNDWVIVVDSISNHAINRITEAFWFSVFLIIGASLILCISIMYLIQLQRRQSKQTKRDLLTGLGNREQLQTNIRQRKALQLKNPVTLFFIKLDHFASIKERMGYSAIDRVLYETAKRLKGLQGILNVYRVGDDEFIVTAVIGFLDMKHTLAEEILKKMEQPFHTIDSETVQLSASIGIRDALYETVSEIVIQDAMFAAMEANKNGGNQFVYVTDTLAKASEQKRNLANNLVQAFDNDEFYLVYQPVYSVDENRIVSFEALMRWKSPTLGEVGPFYFIPLLEESGAIIQVGQWLLRKVANQVLSWESEGYDNFTIALNVSAKQLQHDKFLEEMKRIVKETNVKPERLVFEVTESVVAQDIETATNTLAALNAFGIKTAIDDFGTGYSSLSLLKQLPFQFMKLDRAFVMEVLSDEGKSEAILKGLIEIAESLELTTITEGVETLDQLKVLKRLGTKRIQGYFFSKPVSPDKAVTFLQERNMVSWFND